LYIKNIFAQNQCFVSLYQFDSEVLKHARVAFTLTYKYSLIRNSHQVHYHHSDSASVPVS